MADPGPSDMMEDDRPDARPRRALPIPQALIQVLLEEGASFSFVQVMRLLRLAGGDVPLRDLARVRPHLSLAFPEADVADVEQIRERPALFRVTAQFMGLYGASSPLPTFYTEELMDEQADGYSASRDFLDLVNGPVYPLHFATWARHRLFYNLVECPSAEHLERLYCLVGLGGDSFRRRLRDPYALLRYMGLLEQFPRSAEGLRGLLADYLGEPTLQVLQCLERVVAIPEGQTLRLGEQGHALGEEATLGAWVRDRMGKFRIQAGPLGLEGFQRLLPGSPAFGQMTELVSFFLDRPLAWDLELTLAAGTIQGVHLGDPFWCRLGVNAWVTSRPWDPGRLGVVFEGLPDQ
jgi:type VI secretion system protein ImpH